MPLNLFGRPLHTGPVDPALLEEANRRLFAQARLDSAPAGSVGAPSGVRPASAAVDRRINPFQAAALASSPIPGLGDVMGLAADAQMYATDPESRTMGNFALSGLGLLPFVPALSTMYHGTNATFDSIKLPAYLTSEKATAKEYGDIVKSIDIPDNLSIAYPESRGDLLSLLDIPEDAEEFMDQNYLFELLDDPDIREKLIAAGYNGVEFEDMLPVSNKSHNAFLLLNLK